jgi:hypothetical protein
MGQLLTVTVTLANGDDSNAHLGQIEYSLTVQPDTPLSGDLEPVQHPTTVAPGDYDQAQFVLHATAPGKVALSASTSYEMHATDYSWASWSGCQSDPMEITIGPE